ncbi:unnamed protein product [Meloidogyne enterolobii]|uniref:Uncharacterized protein n=1 Tax=Meloidogyne enterolobii TaxID=390850 RepID=A0ACB0YUL9_MELEN
MLLGLDPYSWVDLLTIKLICPLSLPPYPYPYLPRKTSKKFFSAHILTFIRDRQTHKDRQVLVSSADGTADIKLNAENDKFGGDLKLKKLLVRLHRSAIQIEPESISQLAPLAKMFLGPELAKALKQGLPFPLKDSMKFINPKLTLHDGYVRLASDFELNEQTLRLRMTEAFERIKAESANNIGG